MEKRGLKIIAASVTVGIIVMIIMLSPANAFILGFTVSDNNVVSGEVINFQVSAEVEAGEVLNITHFVLMLTGPEAISCLFTPNGTEISGCDGIEIEQIEDTNFGYGYGYGYGYGFLQGFLKYNITVNSGILDIGEYIAKLIANIDEDDVISQELEITIESGLEPLEGCSIRARDGGVDYQNLSFNNKKSKFSVNVPLKNANKGQGSFGAQGDERISYKFRVKNVGKDGNSSVVFDVSGTFRNHEKDKISLDAKIIYDKITDSVDIMSSEFNVNDLDVGFVRGC